jgi:hypothetical protein
VSARTQVQVAVFLAILVIFYVFLKFITQERAPDTQGMQWKQWGRPVGQTIGFCGLPLCGLPRGYSLGRLASDRANTLSVHAASAGRENGKSTNAWQNTAGTPAAHGKRQLWRQAIAANTRNTAA